MVVQCKACLQEFETTATLLRHISHKEFCKDKYGHGKYETMRYRARLESKRNWRKNKLTEDKINYRKDTYQNKAKGARKDHYYSYVPVSTRRSFAGKAFMKFFQSIYEGKKSQILDDFEEQFLKPKFSDIVESEALDLTFTEFSRYEEHFSIKSGICFLDPELEKSQLDKLVENNMEAALELAYNFHYKTKFDEATKEYIDNLKLLLTQNCLKQTENYAFCNHFGKFEVTTYQIIESKALDVTLMESIDEITDKDVENIRSASHWDATVGEKIEWLLEDKFSSVLNRLVLSHYDLEMANSLSGKIENIMQKQVEYMSN